MVQFDFDSVVNRLIDSLSSKFSHKEILYFSTNRRILETFAEEIVRLAQYDEYLSRETKWGIARNISSLLTQSAFFNYKAYRKMGSTGYLRVGIIDFESGWPYSVSIPKWTSFSGGDLNFVAIQDYSIAPSTPYYDITVKQGIPKTELFEITEALFGTETEYISLQIDNDSIDNSLFSVIVNGTLWSEIDHIRDAEDGTSLVYTIDNLSDFSGIKIKFGNDVFGKKLEIGDMVQVKYLETKGEDGNVLSSGIITSVENTIYDSESNVVDLVCNNIEEIANGRNYESLESIRVNAPKSYQTGDRAMTRDDYSVIIRREALADRVIVWGEKEVNEDLGNPPGTFLPANENLIYISGFNIDDLTGRGIKLTEADKTNIRETLNDLKGPTDIIQFIDTEFVNVEFNIQAFVTDKRFSSEQVRSNIYTALQNNYSLENAEYKKSLRFSQYYEFINSIEGVNHHKTTLSFNVITEFDTAYEFPIEINLNNLKPETVKIYGSLVSDPDNWFLIAEDDGIGNFNGALIDPEDPGAGSYELPGALINYSDGSGTGRITFGLTESYTLYNIKIAFDLADTEEGDLILTKRQQIYYYYDAELDIVQLVETT